MNEEQPLPVLLVDEGPPQISLYAYLLMAVWLVALVIGVVLTDTYFFYYIMIGATLLAILATVAGWLSLPRYWFLALLFVFWNVFPTLFELRSSNLSYYRLESLIPFLLPLMFLIAYLLLVRGFWFFHLTFIPIFFLCIAIPVSMHRISGRWYNSTFDGIPYHGLGAYAHTLWIIISTLLLFLLIRTYYKRMRSWKHQWYFISLGTLLFLPLIASMVRVTIDISIIHDLAPCSVFLFTAFIALVEIYIRRDSTLHPRERLTPLRGYLEEIALAASSSLNFIFRKAPEPISSDSKTPRFDVHPLRSDPHGKRVYSPYLPGKPVWVPVCMHMHSNRWEGKFTVKEMLDYYQACGAGSVIITEHNRITQAVHPVAGPPTYEHGWGPHHHHVLALGAERTFSDAYPLGSGFEQKQKTLQTLRNHSRFLVLAHPNHHNAWTFDDVKKQDYDALEIFNKSCESLDHWRHALNTGRVVWGTAGDDCHDLRSRHQTAKRFLLVDARLTKQELEYLDSLTHTSGVSSCEYKLLPHDYTTEIPDTVACVAQESDYGFNTISPDTLLLLLHLGRFVSVQIKDRFITRSLQEALSIMIENIERTEENLLSFHLDHQPDTVSIISDFEADCTQKEYTYSCLIGTPRATSYCAATISKATTTIALNPVIRY